MSLDRKIVLTIIWAIVLIGFALIARSARAADPHECHQLGQRVGAIVYSATDDIDLQQAVEASAEAHCVLLDEPPITVKVEAAANAGTVPATDPLVPSAKDKWCRSHFRSYRDSDETVIRPGYKRRTACPWPGGD